jgi:hypothetical protein
MSSPVRSSPIATASLLPPLPELSAPEKKALECEEVRQVLSKSGIEITDEEKLKNVVELLNWYEFEIDPDNDDAKYPFTSRIAPEELFGFDSDDFETPFTLEAAIRNALIAPYPDPDSDEILEDRSEDELPIKLYYSSLEEAAKAMAHNNSLGAKEATADRHRPFWNCKVISTCEEDQKNINLYAKQVQEDLNKAIEDYNQRMQEKLSESIKDKKLTPESAIEGKILDAEESDALIKSQSVQSMIERVKAACPEKIVQSCWEGKSSDGTFFQIINFTAHQIVLDEDLRLFVDGKPSKPKVEYLPDDCQIVAYKTDEDNLHLLNKNIGREKVQSLHLTKGKDADRWIVDEGGGVFL